MQIDWLTVGAQIVNFLVLVWLLQHFLYGPVTRAMRQREERIRARLDDAERSRAEAEAEGEAFRAQQQDLERQRADLLSAARAAADEERRSLEREAREAVEARRAEWLGQLEAQRQSFLRDLRRRSTDQFFALARQALDDLANAGLEEQIALGFIAQLDRLDEPAWERIVEGARDGGAIAVRSRFALPADAKRQVTKALRQRIGTEAEVRYEVDEDASCGIELRAGSRTVSWSLASYLEGFEKAVEEQLSGSLAGARAG